MMGQPSHLKRPATEEEEQEEQEQQQQGHKKAKTSLNSPPPPGREAEGSDYASADDSDDDDDSLGSLPPAAAVAPSPAKGGSVPASPLRVLLESKPFKRAFKGKCFPFVVGKGQDDQAAAQAAQERDPGMDCWLAHCAVTGCEAVVCCEHGYVLGGWGGGSPCQCMHNLM